MTRSAAGTTPCEQPGCGGTVEDGYCGICGLAPEPAARCGQPGCTGTVEDGYCTVCGLAPVSTPIAASVTGRSTGNSYSGTFTGTSAGGSRRTSNRTRSSRTARSTRGGLGAGLVEIPRVERRDPATAIMVDPQVPERDRFCSRCGKQVGRGHDGLPGRTEGFCAHCGTAYSFSPKLHPGDLVAGQYEVLGCLAHGGLGWVYLARDRNVSDRWVVLKGLLDSGDADAMAAAAAERRFLASVEHPNIVRIYNFVEHPDPHTGAIVGYIVMEYVGGASLKELRSRRAPDGTLEPLSPATGLAYMLEILPAMSHLHASGLLYCDFKPDNVIQFEEQLKLIDLGAVRRMDDDDSVGYKTDGYCAPELETRGASVESDLYTIGRTLAVLIFNFDYRRAHRFDLPSPADVPVLAQHPSLHRFLLRATAADPDERFGSAAEMVEQGTGVLREVVAAQDGKPRPAMSVRFTPERAVFGADPAEWPQPLRPAAVAAALPVPMVDVADAAAGWLAGAVGGDAARQIAALSAAPIQTYEVRLALVRAYLQAGDLGTATADLDQLEESEDGDWRIGWYRGLTALAAGDPATARDRFEEIYTALPGEAAPKLALAATAECAGDPAAAARLYDLVWRTDHGWPSAAFGLARCLVTAGDFDRAIAAVESVPESAGQYLPARLAAVRIRVRAASERYLVEAGQTLDALDLDPERQARFSIQVLDAARSLVGTSSPADAGTRILNCALTERALRTALEAQYRELARLATNRVSRRDLVNRANAVRPMSWV
ncbi:serine/threonine-protein kinase [Nocardia stercoris]|uniref:non-specific serine/threonine protein kinase n=1 Tax=Nocardia stercoris TaxID=2483361 RepID=A0A3M2LJI3_9NOCA|nr:serine/threonine-protein kinase [Nocardia stercoris]RMI34928.1 serine/threonine protein kinase [Nocardia stercoris]